MLARLLFIFVTVNFLHSFSASSQSPSGPCCDSLIVLYGRHKILPAGYERQALTALSFYPELRDAHIRFVVKKARYPYASRPRLGTLLLPFVRKKYNIVISRKSTELREPTLLKNLPFEAQIGALGHELAHAAHYAQTPKWKILLESLRYTSDQYKEKYEKATDRSAIEHGLGAEIYNWNQRVYPVKLKDGKRGKIYYSPDEIRAIWKKTPKNGM